jgi:universal stress protein E
MSLPQRILVVVDPTADAQPAVQRAAWIARQTRARVELFICAFAPQTVAVRAGEPPDVSRARKAHVENQLRRLHELARPLAATGVDVTVDAVWDSPLHEGIIRKAIAARADLVVKDTHYHPALKRALFSNTDWSLVRTCPVPLWLVKPRGTGATPCFVAAVDPLHERDKPAELDHAILTIGTELSAALGGQLAVFHAFDVAPVIAASAEGMSAPLLLPVPELIDRVKAEHSDAVYALTDGHGIGRDRVHVEQGSPRAQLLALTDRLRADVVVMGAVSRRGLARVFLGNTAEEVLDRLGCDLLIIKPRALMGALREAAA